MTEEPANLEGKKNVKIAIAFLRENESKDIQEVKDHGDLVVDGKRFEVKAGKGSGRRLQSAQEIIDFTDRVINSYALVYKDGSVVIHSPEDFLPIPQATVDFARKGTPSGTELRHSLKFKTPRKRVRRAMK